MYKLGLTGGYDYEELKQKVFQNPKLKFEYEFLMKQFEFCVLEVLIEPSSGIKKFSREYWQDQWDRGRGNKYNDNSICRTSKSRKIKKVSSDL